MNTRVTVDNSLQASFARLLDAAKKFPKAKPILCSTDASFWREKALPEGYHSSGRYMPLQGGSSTQRAVTSVAYINEFHPGPLERVEYRETLEAYFDRISR